MLEDAYGNQVLGDTPAQLPRFALRVAVTDDQDSLVTCEELMVKAEQETQPSGCLTLTGIRILGSRGSEGSCHGMGSFPCLSATKNEFTNHYELLDANATFIITVSLSAYSYELHKNCCSSSSILMQQIKFLVHESKPFLVGCSHFSHISMQGCKYFDHICALPGHQHARLSRLLRKNLPWAGHRLCFALKQRIQRLVVYIGFLLGS